MAELTAAKIAAMIDPLTMGGIYDSPHVEAILKDGPEEDSSSNWTPQADAAFSVFLREETLPQSLSDYFGEEGEVVLEQEEYLGFPLTKPATPASAFRDLLERRGADWCASLVVLEGVGEVWLFEVPQMEHIGLLSAHGGKVVGTFFPV